METAKTLGTWAVLGVAVGVVVSVAYAAGRAVEAALS